MKRYKLGIAQTEYDLWELSEDPDGEWVKWEDVEGILQYKDQLKGYTLETATMKCNCKEELNAMKHGRKSETIGDDVVLTSSWICPAHGYKKR